MNLHDANLLIDRFSHCESAKEVGGVFAAALRTHGFIAVSAGQLVATPQGSQWRFFFNTWPEAWLKIYQERNYVRLDPLPTLALLADRPFTWRDLTHSDKGEEWREFQDWIETLGVVDGFAVPHHCPGNDLGLCVALADRQIDSEAERRAMHLASIYALERCRTLSDAGIPASRKKSPLTERESACMRWVLEGKSDRDIGQILDISKATAHFHVEQVKKKLGVRTRLQAAQRLVALGIA